MHKNSWNQWLSQFSVGEKQYVEITLESYPNAMRTINTPKSRRPECLAGMEFRTELFTAVSNKKAGVIVYLLCVERVK